MGALDEGSGVRMKGGGRISSWNEAGLRPGKRILYGMSGFEARGRISGLSLPCILGDNRSLDS